MKAALRNNRRNLLKTGPGIQLFSFLAVLVCTMGALVPLLLSISRTAMKQARAAAMDALVEKSDLNTKLEDVRWRIEQLRQSRAKTEMQRAEARLELGHIEDHARRLRQQLAQYEKTLAEYERLENADQQKRIETQHELERIRSRIETTRTALSKAGNETGKKPRCYAIVPYEGPNQTRRRPIYLECRADAVILQPEGVRLTESDFEGPMGPGNPLAAALRATREYLLGQKDFDPEAGEPYPLLLVRPEGINAYYAARAAMKSWGSEFGYELIDADWRLAFPPADPRLAEVVRQVIASARASQERLVAAAPRQYKKSPKVVYRASPTRGGFVAETIAEDENEEDADAGYEPARPSSSTGGAYRPGPTGSGVGGVPGQYAGGDAASPQGDAMPGGSTLLDGTSSGNPLRGGGSNGSAADASSFGGAGGMGQGSDGSGTTGPAMGGENANGPELVGSGTGLTAGKAVPGVATSSATAQPVGAPYGSNSAGATQGSAIERPEGYVVGQPPREQAEACPKSESVKGPGRIFRPGEWEPSPELPPESRDEKDKKPDESLAKKRGADWGLRGAARGSVGVTRPIRVECLPDRLIVVAERDPSASKTIPLGPRTASSVDTFISSIWDRMESWGIAGRGMYWRPVLQVHVAPGAEQRYLELAALLEGSGLVVERK